MNTSNTGGVRLVRHGRDTGLRSSRCGPSSYDEVVYRKSEQYGPGSFALTSSKARRGRFCSRRRRWSGSIVECIRRNFRQEIAGGSVIVIPEGAWSTADTMDFDVGVVNSGTG